MGGRRKFMTNDMLTKFEKSLIFIIVIFCLIILAGFVVYVQNTTIIVEGDMVDGELLYLSNISDSDSPSVGVWLEIVLRHPTHVKYGESVFFIELRYSGYKAILVVINNTVNKKGNLTIVHHDLNNDSLISSYDRFHIYGEILTNSMIEFRVNGYWRGLVAKINLTVPGVSDSW